MVGALYKYYYHSFSDSSDGCISSIVEWQFSLLFFLHHFVPYNHGQDAYIQSWASPIYVVQRFLTCSSNIIIKLTPIPNQSDDESNTLHFSSPSPDTETTIPARTTWTLLIYLTATEGGETVFYEDSTSTTPSERSSSSSSSKTIAVAPEVGMALLHRHGERCLLHEGKEVRKGVKWVIRSDLVVAR